MAKRVAKRAITPAQKKNNKAYKRLCALNYTPQTAGRLANILCAMAEEPGIQTEARLRAFEEIAHDKIERSW